MGGLELQYNSHYYNQVEKSGLASGANLPKLRVQRLGDNMHDDDHQFPTLIVIAIGKRRQSEDSSDMHVMFVCDSDLFQAINNTLQLEKIGVVRKRICFEHISVC